MKVFTEVNDVPAMEVSKECKKVDSLDQIMEETLPAQKHTKFRKSRGERVKKINGR